MHCNEVPSSKSKAYTVLIPCSYMPQTFCMPLYGVQILSPISRSPSFLQPVGVATGVCFGLALPPPRFPPVTRMSTFVWRSVSCAPFWAIKRLDFFCPSASSRSFSTYSADKICCPFSVNKPEYFSIMIKIKNSSQNYP